MNISRTAPVNVGQVLPWKAIGGTELATLRIATSARGGGYRSLMFCRSDAPLVQEFFSERGFEVVVFDPACLHAPLPRRIRATLALARQLRAHRISIVHCADIYAGDFAAVAAALAGCRLVCHVRNRYEWVTPFQRLWLLAVDRLVFVSQHTGEVFGRAAAGTASIIRRTRAVLYDGIASGPQGDDDKAAVRRELGIPPDAVVLGMVARISMQKDHLTFVKAAEAVAAHHSEVRFLLVGDDGRAGGAEPAHAAQVLAAIARSPAASHFVCTGYRPDVPRLVSAIDVFVLCTHREGLPLVILEAMAMGKPVVATAVDGIPEIVLHEQTGLLHRHGDSAELAVHLERLVSNPSEATRMGRRGKERIEHSFSEQAFDANVVALYRSLGGSRRTPRARSTSNLHIPEDWRRLKRSRRDESREREVDRRSIEQRHDA